MGNSDGRSHRRYLAAAKLLRETAPSTCHLCGGPIDQTLHHNDPGAWTADHIVPVSECADKGVDPNGIDNLRPAHRSCNCSRGATLRQDKINANTVVNSIIRTRIWH